MNFNANQLLRACRSSSIRSFISPVAPAKATFAARLASSQHARSLATTSSTTTTTTSPPPPPPPPHSSTPTTNTTTTTTTNSTTTPPPASASTSEPQPEVPTTPTQSTPLPPGITRKYGTVISSGLMDRTVRVQYITTSWDKHIRKSFPEKKTYMVSDPRNSLRNGDVVEFWSGWRASKNVRHVVDRIMTPFETGVEERPGVMGYAERERWAKEKAEKKAERKMKAKAKGEGEGEGESEGVEVARMGKIKRKVLARLETERKRIEAEVNAKGGEEEAKKVVE